MTHKVVVFQIPDDCTHVKWQGKEYDLQAMTDAGYGVAAVEYEERFVNGERQVWKKEPGSTEWERCTPCEQEQPTKFPDLPDDDCESCQ